jgi:hypothetical protein
VALLTLGWSKCSICDETLQEGDEIVATTHFIGDESDPLWRFSDSGMHRRCYETREHRDEFTGATANASAACIRAATTKRGRTD